MSEPVLVLDKMPDIEAMHADATKRTGLSNFGPDDYREGLELLIQDYDKDPYLTPECRARCYEQMLGALIGRLRSENEWARHPEALDRKIRGPIIVAGNSRTGTTILHKLLAIDPQFQVLEFWIGNAPQPRPPRSEWAAHPDYRKALAYVEDFYRGIPEYMTIHEMLAEAPEEDRTLLIQNFAHLLFTDSAHLPEYREWVARQPLFEAYDRLADNLKLISMNDDRRWLLKDPMHLAHMEALLRTFPDANVIQTHRHPLQSMASQCSLIHTFRKLMMSPENDPTLIGKYKVDYWARALNQMLDVRQQHPENFLDIMFEDIVRRPLHVVKQVYAFSGIELAPDVESTMAEWIAENRKDKHGKHVYRIEDYGITEDYVKTIFSRYIDEFQLKA